MTLEEAKEILKDMIENKGIKSVLDFSSFS